MTLFLDALTAEDCERARVWRNDESARMGLRTPYMLTEEMQARFYRDVVCDRRADSRWFAVRDSEGQKVQPGGYGDWVTRPKLIGMAGLTGIQWENGLAEISLILDPEARGQGQGEIALGLLLKEAFSRLRLSTLHGEVYENNPAIEFWEAMVRRLPDSGSVTLPRRKFWNGQFWSSLYFWFAEPYTDPRTATLAGLVAEVAA